MGTSGRTGADCGGMQGGGKAVHGRYEVLASMERMAVPTRAEVSDIFRAIQQGAASVMLTGETAAGEHPVEAMEYMVNTVRAAEGYLNRLTGK